MIVSSRRNMSEKKRRETKEEQVTREDAKKRAGANAEDAPGGNPSGETPETEDAGASGENEASPDGPDEQTAAGQEESGDARYMRLAADFQNYKKRTEKEKSDIYAYANEKFAADLLDVIDNFERALGQGAAPGPADAETDGGADEKFLEGMKLIMDQLVNVLERNDVSEIDAAGAEFDPNLHHAVQMEESGEYESGKVTRVIQKGYKIKDKVLRPAMVMVAK
jgi:molecular chaperone GrpE